MPTGARVASGAANTDLLGDERIMHMDFLLPPPQPPSQPQKSTPNTRGNSFRIDSIAEPGFGSPPSPAPPSVPSSFHSGRSPGKMQTPTDERGNSFKFSTPPRENTQDGKLSDLSTTLPENVRGSKPSPLVRSQPISNMPGGSSPIRARTPPPYGMHPRGGINFGQGQFAKLEGSLPYGLQTGSTGMATPLQSGSSGRVTPLQSSYTGMMSPGDKAVASSWISPQRGLSPTPGVSPQLGVSPIRGASPFTASARREVSPAPGVSPRLGAAPQSGVSPRIGGRSLVGTLGPARYSAKPVSSEQLDVSPSFAAAPRSGSDRGTAVLGNHQSPYPGSPQNTSFLEPSPSVCLDNSLEADFPQGAGAGMPRRLSRQSQGAVSGHSNGEHHTPSVMRAGSHRGSASSRARSAPALPPTHEAATDVEEPAEIAMRTSAEEAGESLAVSLLEAEDLLKKRIAEVRSRFERNVRIPFHYHMDRHVISPVREHSTRAVNNAVYVDQRLGEHVLGVHGQFNDVVKSVGFDQGMNAGATLMAQKLDRGITATHDTLRKRYSSPTPKEPAHVRFFRAAHEQFEENVVMPFSARAHDLDQRAGRILHSARETIDRSLERTGLNNGATEGLTAMVRSFEHALERGLSPKRAMPAD